MLYLHWTQFLCLAFCRDAGNTKVATLALVNELPKSCFGGCWGSLLSLFRFISSDYSCLLWILLADILHGIYRES